MECPIKLDKVHCRSCDFIKEGLCDYPYQKDANPEEIERITKKQEEAQ